MNRQVEFSKLLELFPLEVHEILKLLPPHGELWNCWCKPSCNVDGLGEFVVKIGVPQVQDFVEVLVMKFPFAF